MLHPNDDRPAVVVLPRLGGDVRRIVQNGKIHPACQYRGEFVETRPYKD